MMDGWIVRMANGKMCFIYPSYGYLSPMNLEIIPKLVAYKNIPEKVANDTFNISS